MSDEIKHKHCLNCGKEIDTERDICEECINETLTKK